jgi:hypothetical protein
MDLGLFWLVKAKRCAMKKQQSAEWSSACDKSNRSYDGESEAVQSSTNKRYGAWQAVQCCSASASSMHTA